MSAWQPRLLQPGEEESLLQLLTAAYGAWPAVETPVSPLEHLHWKLEAGAGGPNRAVVVEDAGTLVGGVLLSFRPVWINGRPILGTSGADLAVLPAYQGKGIFSGMTSFLLNLNLRTADISYGYRSGHAGVIRSTRPMERGTMGNYADVLRASGKPDEGLTAARELPWAIREVNAFDARVDALGEAAAREFDFFLGRTHELLNARYRDRRAGVFRVLLAEDGETLLGYAVERVSNGGGYIADLLALPGRLDVVESLARRALDDLRAAGVERIECWLPHRHVYWSTLSALGFTRTRTVKSFSYRPLRTPEEELSFLRDPRVRVHVTVGDTDLV